MSGGPKDQHSAITVSLPLTSWVAIDDSIFRSHMDTSVFRLNKLYYYKHCAVNLFAVQQEYYWYCTLMLCIIV